MTLPSTTGVYLYTALYVKKFRKHTYSYLFPNHEQNSNNLIPLKEAIELVTKIMKRLKLWEEKGEEIAVVFTEMAEKDLFIRLLHNKGTDRNESSKNQYISIDYFCNFVLEKYLEKLKTQIISFQTIIGLFGSSIQESKKTFENICSAVDFC